MAEQVAWHERQRRTCMCVDVINPSLDRKAQQYSPSGSQATLLNRLNVVWDDRICCVFRFEQQSMQLFHVSRGRHSPAERLRFIVANPSRLRWTRRVSLCSWDERCCVAIGVNKSGGLFAGIGRASPLAWFGGGVRVISVGSHSTGRHH